MGIRCRIAGTSCVCCLRAPFCAVCAVPLCCEGTGTGECNAVMAEAADVPELADAIDCGRAVEIPETGSVFDDGQRPRGPFFPRAAHAAASLVGAGPRPFVWDDAEDIVDVDDAAEARDEDELARCRLFLGMNMWR
jgi:hypothetical protein